MRRLAVTATLLTALIGFVTPARAQAPECEIELDSIITELESATADAQSGDVESALERIAEAREALASIEAECAASIPVELVETVTAPDGSFTVQLPDGWISDTELFAPTMEEPSLRATTIVFGADPASIAALTNNEDPTPETRAGILSVGTLLGTLIGVGLYSDNEDYSDLTPLEVLELPNDTPDSSLIVQMPQSITINEKEAAIGYFTIDNYVGYLVVIHIDPKSDTWALLLLVGAADDQQSLSPIATAIAGSITVAD
jgi:hypothetical protein